VCAATIAADLLCWLRLPCLAPALADAEPKTLRYRLLHTAARIVRGQRKRKIKIPETWPCCRRRTSVAVGSGSGSPRATPIAPPDSPEATSATVATVAPTATSWCCAVAPAGSQRLAMSFRGPLGVLLGLATK
jgi:Transposase DDE domain group 1